MKILYWNIRGIGNPKSRSEFSSLCRYHNPDLICIAEPMVNFDSIPIYFWHSNNLDFVSFNDRGASQPNIWILYNKKHPIPSVISCTSQQITVQSTMDGMVCNVSFVYASTSHVIRRDLWRDLQTLSTHHPWLVLGDFNAVTGAHEKMGGNLPSRISCDEFCSMIDSCSCNLLHIDSVGSRFTWSNKRDTGSYMELRLARVLCSENWLESWPFSQYVVLPRTVSDHSPLVISCLRNLHTGPKPFRFLSMWTNNADFKSLVSNAWNAQPFYGCPMYVLTQKLKNLKKIFKEWNSKTFGNIHEAVVSARSKLSAIQEDISVNGMTEDRFQVELNANLEVKKLFMISIFFGVIKLGLNG